MATLAELLVRLGVDADGLTQGMEQAANRAEASLDSVGDAGRQAGLDAARGMDAVSNSLDEVGTSAEQASADAQQAADNTEQSLRGIAGTAAGAAVGGLFIAGLTEAMDITSANAKLTAQLDLTQAEAQRAGDVAGDVFSSGIGDSIGTVNDALGAVVQNIGGMGEASDAELRQMTKSALMLADTFEFDLNEATQAAGTLLKSGLAANGQEAFDLLTAAAQKLPPLMREELPAIATEYTEFFDQLGFTGPQMMGLLAEAAKSPTFQLDKLGDAVKEFSLRLAETDAVKEPLKELGLDVKEIQELVNKGQGTKAFDMVTEALRGVEDQTERTALQAALFGGPGEDLGNSLLKLNASSAAAKNGLSDVAGTAKSVTDSMQASPAQSFESIMRSLSTTLGETLAPVLTTVAGLFEKHPGLVQALVPIVLALAAGLAIAAIAQWAMNSAMLANPVTWIIVGIVALIAAIVAIATKTTWFQDLWRGMVDGISAAWDWIWGKLKAGFRLLVNAAKTAWGWITSTISGAWNAIKSGTAAAWNWIVGKIRGAINLALSIIRGLGRLPGIVGNFFARMTSSAVAKIGDLINRVRGIPGRVIRAVGNLGRLLWNAGRDIIRGLINGVTSMIGRLGNKLRDITNMIPSWKGPLTVDLRLLEPSGEALMDGLMTGIDSGEEELRRQLQGVTNSISASVNPGASRVAARAQHPLEVRYTLVLEGGDRAFVDFLKQVTRTHGGGSIVRLAEG